MTDQTSTIPKGWKMSTLGEIVILRQGRYIPDDILSITKDTKRIFPVFGGGGLRGYTDFFEYEKRQPIITCRGSGCGFIQRTDVKASITNSSIAFEVNEDYLDIGFVYYWALGRDFSDVITGSAQPQITIGALSTKLILIPTLPEQRAIAAVLSSLDDKIELLREQNKTLEAIAQTIFKEWFVNFNFPGTTGKMIDSELGQIPEGWKVGRLGDEFDITIGRTPPRLETEWFSDKPTGKKWISIKDIGNSEMYISNTSEYLTDEAIEKFNIPLIPENTTILSFKMTVGKLAITTEEMLSNEAIAHLKIKNNSNFSTEFIYLFLKGLDFNSLGSTSSIVTAINSTMIKALGILVPEDQIIRQFNAIIQPIFAKLKNNNSQIQFLSTLRDTLLSKLMNGEVRVEKFND
ncbi:MAG: restriction endonuclease subunit S [Candidatus Falkowbacteria bacterium]|nr:MAG: restriction endonuclease subunit S [Candidatus Falkowbacteria bacterium]